MSQKKILIILIATLFGLITFLGGYLLANKNTGQTANIAGLNRFSSFSGKTEPEKNVVAKLNRLSSVKVIGPTVSEDGRNLIYFEKDTGKIFSSNFTGQNTQIITGEIKENITEAIWSKNGRQAIVAKKTPRGQTLSLFDLKNKDLINLNGKMSSATWSPDGQKIAYLFFEPAAEEGNISIANPDGSSFKNILPTRNSQLKIAWPGKDIIAFHSPSGIDKSLLLLNKETGELEKILESYDNLKTLWSPDGLSLIYSYNKEGVDLTANLIQLKDGNYFGMEIDLQTNAEKCVWSLNSKRFYCGGTKTDGEEEGLYEFALTNKEFGLVFQSSSADQISIEKPFLSPTENFIFFTNGYDRYLYSISL
ncbi:MAG: PD40 domain-containing protein [Candidatus Yanofskybacteria bacterium]|nr:PD40 domain-containing protein [Candidatus Yanofskybacteria bacterium]